MLRRPPGCDQTEGVGSYSGPWRAQDLKGNMCHTCSVGKLQAEETAGKRTGLEPLKVIQSHLVSANYVYWKPFLAI